MAASDPQFDRKLAAIFQAEAAGHVERMQDCLAQLEGGAPPQQQPLALLFRAAHSLKGAARAVGEDAIELACHAAESLLAALQRGELAWSPAVADALHELAAALAQALRQHGSAAGTLAALLPRFERLARGDHAPAPAPAPVPAGDAVAPAAIADAHAPHPAEQTVRIGVERLGRLLYQVEELVAA
jgi:two-component system chemotaxis sensor kinase CheA